MLKTIRLKNFKLHEDTSIEAAPITVFIGPNNSGKSSIFQAMLLLRQAAARNDQFLCQPPAGIQPPPTEDYLHSPNLMVDVGTFEEAVRKGDNEIDIQLCGDVRAQRPVGDIEQASLCAHLRVRKNLLVYHGGVIEISGTKTIWEYVQGGELKNPTFPLGHVDLVLQIFATFQLMGPAGYRNNATAPGFVLPPEVQLQYNEMSKWLGTLPTALFRSMHPVYALRGFEEWGYPITNFPPANLDLMTLHDRELALPNAMAADRQLKERLSARIEELLHISIDFEVVLGKRLKIWAKHSDTNSGGTLFANEGTGANQLPFILVPIALAQSNETILLSEPEVHLHPKKQCELTSLILTLAKKEKIQFFIETHSEHVLHSILNAVARGEWSPEDVALYYFQNKNGAAEVSKREINQFGQVDGGLPDFFEQSLAELTDYLKALSKT
jgi:energy-coupling factor transporter ATP-binding protein EcfA2